MKIKIVEILNASEVLTKISKQDLQIGAAKLGYILYKNIQNINKEIGYFIESRNKIINKYGEKNEKGNYNTDKNGNVVFSNCDLAKKELNDILQMEVNCDLNKFSLEELSNWSMSAQDISKIAFMINNK